MRIYISGKMRGLPEEESRKLFKAAENYLIELGHDVINPWDSEGEKNEKCKDWDDYILYDLQILKTCDAIFMLSNWQDSDGAKCEHAFASGRHMEIIYEKQVSNSIWHSAMEKPRDYEILIIRVPDGKLPYSMWSQNFKIRNKDFQYCYFSDILPK